MFIYVDESGSFVHAPKSDSWCVVAGYVVPEAARKQVEQSLALLKRRLGRGIQDEVKLKDLSEANLTRFLGELGKLEATLFISAIDLGHQDPEVVVAHQAKQVESVRANRPNMLYEEGRASIDDLSGRLERLSPQLYTQMVAQSIETTALAQRRLRLVDTPSFCRRYEPADPKCASNAATVSLEREW